MDDPIRVRPVVEADVGLVPAGPLAAVAVALDEARQDDLVPETIVDLVRPPARELLEGPGAEDQPSRTATWLASGWRTFMVTIFFAG